MGEWVQSEDREKVAHLEIAGYVFPLEERRIVGGTDYRDIFGMQVEFLRILEMDRSLIYVPPIPSVRIEKSGGEVALQKLSVERRFQALCRYRLFVHSKSLQVDQSKDMQLWHTIPAGVQTMAYSASGH